MLEELKRINLTAHLYDACSGERVVHQSWAYEESAEYLWSEGNFSCDCNRSMFFYGAEDNIYPCDVEGERNIWVERLVNADTGVVLAEWI